MIQHVRFDEHADRFIPSGNLRVPDGRSFILGGFVVTGVSRRTVLVGILFGFNRAFVVRIRVIDIFAFAASPAATTPSSQSTFWILGGCVVSVPGSSILSRSR